MDVMRWAAAALVAMTPAALCWAGSPGSARLPHTVTHLTAVQRPRELTVRGAEPARRGPGPADAPLDTSQAPRPLCPTSPVARELGTWATPTLPAPSLDRASSRDPRVREHAGAGSQPSNHPSPPPKIPSRTSGTADAASTPPAEAAAPTSSAAPMVLGYYTQYTPDSTSSQESLAAHVQQVTAIAPLWYSVTTGGTLNRLGYDHAAVRVWAAVHHVTIYPLVINGHGNDTMLQNAAIRARALSALTTLARQDGYPGYNIDFENLNNDDEAGLDTFVSELVAALAPLGKQVIVAVGPRTSNANAYHVYNYQVLGHAAAALVLMTYDDHDIGSSPGPIAPIQWVRRILAYALEEVPASKIILGLAVYGYNWSSDGATVEVHDPEALSLAETEGVPVVWNAADAEPMFTYTAADGTVHQVWYENGYSDAFKIALANQDHLRGVAIWRLGDEDSALWRALAALK